MFGATLNHEARVYVSQQELSGIQSATLSSANVVYDDINRATVSADGYYSDGNFVRLQKTGFLPLACYTKPKQHWL